MSLPNVCQPRRSIWAFVLVLCALACARTGLDPAELEAAATDPEVGGSGGSQAATDPEVGGSGGSQAATTGGVPRAGGGNPSMAAAGASSVPASPQCVPSPETCNGSDDDCDGVVDDVPSEACPGGGARFCIAGRMSQCPRRCDVCVAGSTRICQNSFCSFWGEQECAADGQGFGHCRESKPPSECASVAKAHEKSRELEQCCLDNGYCCLDEFDLDGDGNRSEMLGACGDVVCP